MKTKWYLLILSTCFMQTTGQTLFPDVMLDIEFNAQVKSVDEFLARFNGKESKPGLFADSLRQLNVMHLFDIKMSRQGMDEQTFKKQVRDFARTASSWDKPLAIDDKGTIAEARCLVKHGGKNKHVTLLLQCEKAPKGGYRWGISGVKGLKEIGIYNDKLLTISPVEHEIHFMSLQDFFGSNKLLLPQLRLSTSRIDELSLFFGLCMAKAIVFVQVDELKIHFNAMPRYSFVIEEVIREGTNSGWLITRMFETPTIIAKEKHISEIFHKTTDL